MITVVAAPPFLTVQDLGRTGHRAAGVAPSGAMDRSACRAVNAAVGNTPGAAVLEWAVAGGVLRFDVATTIALGGASVVATVDDVPASPGPPIAVRAGAELRVAQFVRGRFLYIGVAGGIDVPLVLDSRSTNIVAGFGGMEGRRLRCGDVLPGGPTRPTAEGAMLPGNVDHVRGDSGGVIRVVRGPQADLFGEEAWTIFLGATYTVSRASDRMGYRLDGPALRHDAAAALPSEPVCEGAVQVPDGGAPIVLMNDGPTIGGYPKIAVITTADLGVFAQRTPGEAVRFSLG
jgi:biotin-dependent carboxylase-like uncharacterized protein